MKKLIAILFIIFAVSHVHSQLIDGEIVNEGRKLITPSTFVLVDTNSPGVMYYELSVDRNGDVTGARLLSEGTTVNSTPVKIKARNYLMKLKFEPGTIYPHNHHVRVKLTIKES